MILEVEKLVYGGAGLCHNEEGRAVFVKGVLPEEKIRVNISKKNKSCIKADLVEIIEPSANRIKPACPYSTPCGGCDFAFANYEYQLKLKEEIIREIFNGVNISPIIKSPKILHYRAKTQFPARQTKNSKRMLIGYFKQNTHEIINIKYCPVHPEIIDNIAEFFRNEWKDTCYEEKNQKGKLRHINTRTSSYNSDIILTLVLNAKNISGQEIMFTKKIMKKFPQIKSVFANFNTANTNKITGNKTVLIAGQNYIIEKLGDCSYKIGSDSFFQVNPLCAKLLFEEAKKLIKNKGELLDLYGGAGAIGIFMKNCAAKIVLVEQNEEAARLAEENYKLNGIENYEIYKGDAAEIMQKFIKQKRKFENIVIDPPRKGSDKKTIDAIAKMTNSVIYISCNPMTLKRDSDLFIEKGFKLSFLVPADMFPNTHHIELAAHFERVLK